MLYSVSDKTTSIEVNSSNNVAFPFCDNVTSDAVAGHVMIVVEMLSLGLVSLFVSLFVFFCVICVTCIP